MEFEDDLNFDDLAALDAIETEHLQKRESISTNIISPQLSHSSQASSNFQSPSGSSYNSQNTPRSNFNSPQNSNSRSGLNHAQHEAVQSDPYLPLMILAGPGSGKV